MKPFAAIAASPHFRILPDDAGALIQAKDNHSHSMVAGGFEEMS